MDSSDPGNSLVPMWLHGPQRLHELSEHIGSNILVRPNRLYGPKGQVFSGFGKHKGTKKHIGLHELTGFNNPMIKLIGFQ